MKTDQAASRGAEVKRCESPPKARVADSDRANSPTDFELARFAKAIGHPARVKILRYLASRDSCLCGDIVDEIALAQSTVSQHLKILKDSGLIQGEINPPRVCYCIDPAAIARLKALVDGL
jgi:ArsR family transcriptional regulator